MNFTGSSALLPEDMTGFYDEATRASLIDR